jgi:hypothetical protein
MVTVNRTGGNAVIRITVPIPSGTINDAATKVQRQMTFDEKVDAVLQQAIKELNDYWAAVHVNTSDCDAELARIQAEIAARKASKVVVDLS